MNFDRIAPFYGPMERWLAGKCLHRCRTAFLGEIPVPRRVLMVGEGHGRFLGAFRERFPEADITVLDGSAKMLEISKARLADHRGVEFVHDVRWRLTGLDRRHGRGGADDRVAGYRH